MARIPIAPLGMKDQRPRYTLGWRVGNHIYVADQLPFDKDGNLIGKGDIKAQTRRIFEQIKMIVEAGGGKMDDVVKVTVFVTDVRYREPYGEVRSEFLRAQSARQHASADRKPRDPRRAHRDRGRRGARRLKALNDRTSPRPSWASSPNSKRDSTADQEGRAGDSVIVAAAIS
jgi:enamine deaminase RidA (YjgF/YER057c/UK114 family)